MTTLRTFQTEIDEIAHRELIKQRTHTASTVDQEKENRQPLSPSAKGKAKDAGHINGAEPAAENNKRSGLHEIEEKILVRSCTAIS